MSAQSRLARAIVAVAAAVLFTGCGLFYDVGSRIRTSHMANDLKPGLTSLQVYHEWGEPDLQRDIGAHEEIWSYAHSPNINDLTAEVFYTSTKPGDESKFLDLKFVHGKLVSWNEAVHTMPAKQGAGFSYGLGPSLNGLGPGITGPPGSGATASPLTKY